VEAGRFRRDLFFRLAQVSVEIPPLRERREDLPALVGDLLGELVPALHLPPDLRLDEASLFALQAQDWPGNVRELETFLHRAAVGCQGNVLSIAISGATPTQGAPRAGRHRPYLAAKRDFDLAYYEPLNVEFKQNVKRIADVADRERSTVRTALFELGLRSKQRRKRERRR
jgi:DNA-binding NtrC family response regulator